MGDKSAVEELLKRNTSLLTEKNIKEFLICHAEKLDVENGGVYEVISMRNMKDDTPLHEAIRDTVQILLEKKPGLIYEKDSYGRTPLHYAAASSDFLVWIVCGHLLKRDSSIALLQDHYQATPAHLAAECGRRKALITILNACPHSVELLNQQRQNILHVAAQNGSVIADDLINEPDKDGNTPLHLAAMNFHSSVVRCLALTRKVDIRAINNDGKTALDVAQV
ncbi:hypothetical protein AAG906_011846 [Vitis piasezkii]